MVLFRLFRRDAHQVLVLLTRSMTTLAHLYDLAGWLKI